MSKVAHLIRWNVVLQIRSHLYTATLVTTAFLCSVALLVPWEPLPVELTAILVFTDPAVIGLSFVGGFVLMERGQNTLAALAVTPLSGRTYILAMVASFTLLGALAGTAVAWVATGGRFDAAMLALALLLSNAVAVLVGFALVARARSVNAFLAYLSVAAFLDSLPLVGYLGFAPALLDRALWLIPSYAMLELFDASVDAEPAGGEVVVGIAYLLAWIVIGWAWCVREFEARVRSGGL